MVKGNFCDYGFQVTYNKKQVIISFESNYLTTVSESMPKRAIEVIRQNGYSTRY